MLYHLLAQLVALLIDLFTTSRRSDQQKDLEILLLRQQLRILQRHHPASPREMRGEKLGLAVLAARFTGLGHGAQTKLNQVLLFKPGTVLKWHRELVRRKWTFDDRPTLGRPVTSASPQ
jgi:hypothetical protein